MMCDDLLDARAAVEWATAQIPLLQSGFLEWSNRIPYRTVWEPELDGWWALVVYEQIPLPLTINAWTGAIINSLRSALDLTAASLARRNGKDPQKARTQFPIGNSLEDSNSSIAGIRWLTAQEKADIKALEPYQGGDAVIWSLHRLDIVRKHHRLISASPEVGGFLSISEVGGRGSRMMLGGSRGIERLDGKTVLQRCQ